MKMSNINSPLCLNLLENSPSFIIVTDDQQHVYWVNQSFCDFLGMERDQLLGVAFSDIKEPCLKQVLEAAPRVEVFAGILDKWIELQDVMRLNGEQFGEENKELTVLYYTDASKAIEIERQLLQLESTLSHKMSHDPVTGMLNHHSMFQTLNSEVSRSRRYDNPLSVVLMTVDYEVENKVLAPEEMEQIRLVISQLLKDQMRWADIVGHLNGFDFVLLLPETVYESAEVLVKKLNTSLKNASIDVSKINYGLSQWQRGDDVKMFVERAIKELDSETVK